MLALAGHPLASEPETDTLVLLQNFLWWMPRLLTDKEDDNGNEPYQIGLWGDVPYGDAQAQTGVPNLIKHMNSFPLKFSVVSSAGSW